MLKGFSTLSSILLAMDIGNLLDRIWRSAYPKPDTRPGHRPSGGPGALSRFFLACFVLWHTILPSPRLLAEPTAAVAGIHASPGLGATAASLTPMLRDAFQRRGDLSILTEAAIRQSLAGKQRQLRDAVFVQPARDALVQARKLAGMAQFRQAIDQLKRAEAHLTYYREQLTSNEDFLEIERLLLQLQLGLGAYDEAAEIMHRLATVAPQLKLDPLHFSAQSIELFERVKSELRYATGLRVTSEPSSAAVFLDGTPRGYTPLFLPQIPQGRHYIRLEGDGGVFFQDIEVDSSDTQVVHGVLRGPVFHSAESGEMDEAGDAARLTTIYHALGSFLRVDYLVIAQLDEEGIEAALFHVRTSTFTPSYKVPVEPGRPARPLLERLVVELSSMVSPEGEPLQTAPLDRVPSPDSNFLLRTYFFDDLAPGLLTSPQIATGQGQRKRPFYRRAWFWGATGVAAVVGGALGWYVVTGSENGNETVSIRFHFPVGQ